MTLLGADARTIDLDADGFIERHGLWDDPQREAARAVLETIAERGIKRVRIGWGDQHGIVRGKTLTIREFARSLSEGKDFQLVTAIFDTTNHPIAPPFGAGNFKDAPELTGLPDGVLVPDPTTFRQLPWVGGHGLGAVRRVLRERPADAVLHPGDPARPADRAGDARLRLRRRPRDRVLHHEARRSDALARALRLAARATKGERPVAWFPVPHREPWRRDPRAPERAGGARRRPRAPTADDRGRVGSGAGRVHVRAGVRPGRRRQRAALPHRDEADLSPPRLPRHVHGPPCVPRLLLDRVARPPVAAPARVRARQRVRLR